MKEHDLIQANRYLDGELTGRQREEFEELMRVRPELAEYVRQIENLDSSIRSMGAIEAPPVEFKRRIFPRIAALPVFHWRIPALPAVALGLLFLAMAFWYGAGAGANTPDSMNTSVKFVYFSKTAESVSVVGSFNGWKEAVNLHLRGESGYWVAEVPLDPGEYSYAFIIDGKVRIADPTADSLKEDYFGSKNSILRVGV